jgi:hypothetical protein
MTRAPDARLWHAVLAHALTDAAKGTDANWLGSEDFNTVRALAGVDPHAVICAYQPERHMRLGRAA